MRDDFILKLKKPEPKEPKLKIGKARNANHIWVEIHTGDRDIISFLNKKQTKKLIEDLKKLEAKFK